MPRRHSAPVSIATPADLPYVVHLQKRHGHAVRFIPRMALREKIDLRQISIASLNGEPAGFLHHGSLAGQEVRIFQAAIEYDARRRHLGLALVADLIRRATEAAARGVSLRCLSFLEANDFWTAAGFLLIATEPGVRGVLNVWGRRIDQQVPQCQAAAGFIFHSRIRPCPGCGISTPGTWTRGARRHRHCPACVMASIKN